MFRRVREATLRGKAAAKSLLNRAGRAVKRTGAWIVVGSLYAVHNFGRLLQGIARAATWLWMSAVEVYSITQSPFTWALGNVLFAVMRGVEWLTSKIRGRQYTWVRDHLPYFTLTNAVAINNTALYPFIALVGWVLSPISGPEWWRKTANSFKRRTVVTADMAYADGIGRDLVFKPDYVDPATAWAEATAEATAESVLTEDEQERIEGPEATAIKYTSEGFRRIFPDPNVENPADAYDYITERVGDDNWILGMHQDAFGRYWAGIDLEVDLNPPARVMPPVVHVEAKTTQEFRAADYGEHMDISKITSNRERSFAFGVGWARAAADQDVNFLTSTERQNIHRSLMLKEAKGPTHNYIQSWARKGFNAELVRQQEAATANH